MGRLISSKDVIFTPEYDLGQVVYLKTNDSGQPYQVVAFVVSTVLKYRLQSLGEITEHEAFEISPDLDAVLSRHLEELDEEE